MHSQIYVLMSRKDRINKELNWFNMLLIIGSTNALIFIPKDNIFASQT